MEKYLYFFRHVSVPRQGYVADGKRGRHEGRAGQAGEQDYEQDRGKYAHEVSRFISISLDVS